MTTVPPFRRIRYTPGDDPMTWRRAKVTPFVAWPPAHLRITPSEATQDGRRVLVMECHGRWAGAVTETERPGVFVGTCGGGVYFPDDAGAVILQQYGAASMTLDYFPGLTADHTELVEFADEINTNRNLRDG
jgi:hypothetical protein